ncbi:MAG: SDR family oxidoreductase [Sphingomonadales bacterium]|nr:SDR family oxidoreductase [Sphingomonadales bacterium]
MPELSGKANVGAVLITGGAKRIGREISRTLARTQPVVIHYHNSASEADALATELGARGLTAATVQADLDNENDVTALIQNASEAANQPITALINNASIFEDDTPLTVSKRSFDKHMSINLWAPLALSQALAKALPDGTKGHIINIIDQRVLTTSTGFTSYTLSKSALWSQTRNLAKELAPNIQVNAIAPGPVLKSIHQSEGDFANEINSLPLGRGASANDIARSVLFLLENNAITGEIITLDGGQHLL